MTAAVFGLLGVIVGGVINGVVSAVLARRTERADRRSAARLVRSELVRFRWQGIAAREVEPDDLPQLRSAGTELWNANRAVLARALADSEWALVARAYAHVEAVQSVLVFEPGGLLVDWRRREAKRLLDELVDPVEEAALVLGGVAGLRVEKLDEVSAALAEFPEAGPDPPR